MPLPNLTSLQANTSYTVTKDSKGNFIVKKKAVQYTARQTGNQQQKSTYHPEEYVFDSSGRLISGVKNQIQVVFQNRNNLTQRPYGKYRYNRVGDVVEESVYETVSSRSGKRETVKFMEKNVYTTPTSAVRTEARTNLTPTQRFNRGELAQVDVIDPDTGKKIGTRYVDVDLKKVATGEQRLSVTAQRKLAAQELQGRYIPKNKGFEKPSDKLEEQSSFIIFDPLARGQAEQAVAEGRVLRNRITGEEIRTMEQASSAGTVIAANTEANRSYAETERLFTTAMREAESTEGPLSRFEFTFGTGDTPIKKAFNIKPGKFFDEIDLTIGDTRTIASGLGTIQVKGVTMSDDKFSADTRFIPTLYTNRRDFRKLADYPYGEASINVSDFKQQQKDYQLKKLTTGTITAAPKKNIIQKGLGKTETFSADFLSRGSSQSFREIYAKNPEVIKRTAKAVPGTVLTFVPGVGVLTRVAAVASLPVWDKPRGVISGALRSGSQSLQTQSELAFKSAGTSILKKDLVGTYTATSGGIVTAIGSAGLEAAAFTVEHPLITRISVGALSKLSAVKGGAAISKGIIGTGIGVDVVRAPAGKKLPTLVGDVGFVLTAGKIFKGLSKLRKANIVSTQDLNLRTVATDSGATTRVAGLVKVQVGKSTFNVKTGGKEVLLNLDNKMGIAKGAFGFQVGKTKGFSKVESLVKFTKDGARFVSIGKTATFQKFQTVRSKVSPQQFAESLSGKNKITFRFAGQAPSTSTTYTVGSLTRAKGFKPDIKIYKFQKQGKTFKVFSDKQIQKTIAHELVHYKQSSLYLRTEKGVSKVLIKAFPKQKYNIYKYSPSEIRARIGAKLITTGGGISTKVKLPKITGKGSSISIGRVDTAIEADGLKVFRVGSVSKNVFGSTKRGGFNFGYVKENLKVIADGRTITQSEAKIVGAQSKKLKIKLGNFLRGGVVKPGKNIRSGKAFGIDVGGKGGKVKALVGGGTESSQVSITIPKETATSITTVNVLKGAKTTAKAAFAAKWLPVVTSSTQTIKTLGGITRLKTRQRTFTRPKPIVKPQPRQRAYIKPITRPKLDTAQANKVIPAITTIQTSIGGQRTDSRTRVIPIITPITRPGRPTTPITPPPVPPPTKIIPLVRLQPERVYTRKRKKVQPIKFFGRPFAYTASFTASQFGIRGRKPRKLSGLELRPLAKNSFKFKIGRLI